MTSNTHYVDIAPSILALDAKASFEQLSKQEKIYAHFMREYILSLNHAEEPETDIIRAAFCGKRIIAQQVSPESLKIFDLVLMLAKLSHDDWKTLSVQSGVSDDTMDRFLEYCSTVLDNLGNYQVCTTSNFGYSADWFRATEIANSSHVSRSLTSKIFAACLKRQSLCSLPYPNKYTPKNRGLSATLMLAG